ncbi:unnamed protein product [Cercospora beticola]|nr:unnamed protein product [Cercospora beticola]
MRAIRLCIPATHHHHDSRRAGLSTISAHTTSPVVRSPVSSSVAAKLDLTYGYETRHTSSLSQVIIVVVYEQPVGGNLLESRCAANPDLSRAILPARPRRRVKSHMTLCKRQRSCTSETRCLKHNDSYLLHAHLSNLEGFAEACSVVEDFHRFFLPVMDCPLCTSNAECSTNQHHEHNKLFPLRSPPSPAISILSTRALLTSNLGRGFGTL